MPAKKKTIEELNEKAWYRLLKVLYTGFFAVVTVIALLGIHESTVPYDIVNQDASTVVCNSGNERTFAFSDISGLYITTYDIKGFGFNKTTTTDSWETDDILSACGISKTEYLAAKTSGEASFYINPIIITEGGTDEFVQYSAIALIIIFAIFEIVKRSFYYVVTGTFSPKKHAVTEHRSET